MASRRRRTAVLSLALPLAWGLCPPSVVATERAHAQATADVIRKPQPPDPAKLRANRVKFDDGRNIRITRCTVDRLSRGRSTYRMLFPEGAGLAVTVQPKGARNGPSTVVVGDGRSLQQASKQPVRKRKGFLLGSATFAEARTPFALAYKVRLSSCRKS